MTKRQRGPFDVVSSREIHRNSRLILREDQVRRPDGSNGTFTYLEMKPGSTVLAINRHDEVYLVREYKYAVDRSSLELISGGIDPGESPLEAARRELKEESGLEARDWIELGVIDPFTSQIASANHMFMALEVDEGDAAPDAGEYLDIVKLPFNQVVEMVLRSEITHGASCVLILKAAHYRAKLAR